VSAIILNTRDDPRARVFTVVHELAHLYLAAHEGRGPDGEGWCNELASDLLMPLPEVRMAFRERSGSDLLGSVDELALLFGVTPLAMTVRLARAQLISSQDEHRLKARLQTRSRPREAPGGGGHYRARITRLGPSFVRLVFSALESGVTTYPTASGLLGIKVDHFPTLRHYLDERPISV